jgi:hypothetical protein
MNLESLKGLIYFILDGYLAQKLVLKSLLKSLRIISMHFLKKQATRSRKLTGLPFILAAGFFLGHPIINYYRVLKLKQYGENNMARNIITTDKQAFAYIQTRRQERLRSLNPE